MSKPLLAIVAAVVAVGLAGLAVVGRDAPVAACPVPPPSSRPPSPAPVAVVARAHTCVAVDEDGALIAAAAADQPHDCRARLRAAVTAFRCAPATRKVRYRYLIDRRRPSPAVVFCG